MSIHHKKAEHHMKKAAEHHVMAKEHMSKMKHEDEAMDKKLIKKEVKKGALKK